MIYDDFSRDPTKLMTAMLPEKYQLESDYNCKLQRSPDAGGKVWVEIALSSLAELMNASLDEAAEILTYGIEEGWLKVKLKPQTEEVLLIELCGVQRLLASLDLNDKQHEHVSQE